MLRGPEAIETQLFFRVARPIFAIAGWRASVRSVALKALLEQLRAPPVEGIEGAWRAAFSELEANVTALERVAIVKKRSPVAHALWLRRVLDVLTLAHEDESAAQRAARQDPSVVFAPLVPLEGAGAPPDAEPERLIDVELAAIDHLLAAARAETQLLGRRRRLCVAARQRLLEAAAALPIDPEGIKDRTRYLAREIHRLDRLEAAGLAADTSLVHQARQALARKDPDRLFASLNAIDANAFSAGDRDVWRRTRPALTRIGPGDAAASIERSARELLGDVVDHVADAVDTARMDANERMAVATSFSERQEAQGLLLDLPADAATAVVRAAAVADGLFEVGGALAPVRVTEEERVLRLVRHPTQTLLLRPAEDVDDIRDAVIVDPRSILLDLATGRLFSRRFVREEVRAKKRIVMHGEVRVYVLDGSGSMRGPRARVRDAILVAELSTLMQRLSDPGDVRCTLFYRYFNDELGLSYRVATIAEAKNAIRDVVATQRSGGTDIQKALLASLAQIADARAHDPDLRRAQIVLVTDGESPIDEAALVAARDAVKGVPIGVSVIALGQENAALRGIVARQRSKGEAAFYHFIDDEELEAITLGLATLDDAIHAPARWREHVSLEDEVGGLLDELESLDRERDVAALEHLEEEAQARREVGLPEEDEGPLDDGSRARTEALRRDRVALDARFLRWFPPESGAPAIALPKPGSTERDEIEATCAALASVAEVVSLLGGTPLARRADAIDLIERLLPDARLSPARYRGVLRAFPAAVAPSLKALRDAVDGSHGDRVDAQDPEL
jgi:hypothetical protein